MQCHKKIFCWNHTFSFFPRVPYSVSGFYFMYNIRQDAGIRTRVAATAARFAINELHTSLQTDNCELRSMPRIFQGLRVRWNKYILNNSYNFVPKYFTTGTYKALAICRTPLEKKPGTSYSTRQAVRYQDQQCCGSASFLYGYGSRIWTNSLRIRIKKDWVPGKSYK